MSQDSVFPTKAQIQHDINFGDHSAIQHDPADNQNYASSPNFEIKISEANLNFEDDENDNVIKEDGKMENAETPQASPKFRKRYSFNHFIF